MKQTVHEVENSAKSISEMFDDVSGNVKSDLQSLKEELVKVQENFARNIETVTKKQEEI